MTTPNIEELRLLAQTLEFSDAVRCSIQRAADLLQSQAERIKELEFESSTHLRMRNLHYGENEKLRAQLEAIAATEPSMIYHGRYIIDCGDSGHQDVTMLKMIARETKLFTRPMPAQDVTELVEALEKLARLGNGEHYGNSDGNMIARDALSKYKGAK